MAEIRKSYVPAGNFEIPANVADNLRTVFAYQMRDEISIFGATKVNKQFDGWLVTYLANKAETDYKAISARMESKKDAAVIKLQKLGLSYKEACERVYGVALVNNAATEQVAGK